MKIAVFAKAGTLAQHRWVRLTGVQDAFGAYECEAVGLGMRPHAIILDHPTGSITPTVPGYAETLGRIVQAECAAPFGQDVELRSNPNGTVQQAILTNYSVAVSLTAGATGGKVLIMLRWGGML